MKTCVSLCITPCLCFFVALCLETNERSSNEKRHSEVKVANSMISKKKRGVFDFGKLLHPSIKRTANPVAPKSKFGDGVINPEFWASSNWPASNWPASGVLPEGEIGKTFVDADSDASESLGVADPKKAKQILDHNTWLSKIDDILGDNNADKTWKKFFDGLDENADDALTKTEVGVLFQPIIDNLRKTDLQAEMNRMDTNGDGTLDFDEFRSAMTGDKKDAVTKVDYSVFCNHLDKNNNSFVSALELKNGMMKVKINDEEADRFIKDADHDGDGEMNCNEFVKKMKSDSTKG